MNYDAKIQIAEIDKTMLALAKEETALEKMKDDQMVFMDNPMKKKTLAMITKRIREVKTQFNEMTSKRDLLKRM